MSYDGFRVKLGKTMFREHPKVDELDRSNENDHVFSVRTAGEIARG